MLFNPQDINVIPAEEQAELVRKAQDGDKEALSRVLMGNMKMIISIANDYAGADCPAEDLINEGVADFMTGIYKYDPNKGTTFSTYIYTWVKRGVYRGLWNNSQHIKLPLWVWGAAGRYKKAGLEYLSLHGTEIPDDAAAQVIGVDKNVIKYIKDYGGTILSLNKKDSEDDNEFGSIIPAEGDFTQETLDSVVWQQFMADVKEKLPDKEWSIIKLRYGIDGDEPMTCQEVAELYGVTRQCIHRIEKRALTRLKKDPNIQKFRKAV